MLVDVRLPEGKVLNLTETEGLIDLVPGQPACVELRRHTVTGQDHYRLRLAHRCTD